ncbi:MAG TPA: serine/threonine-protein kinase [Gaiellaceae bacterium]|nr:serine/threonine-protein kinase [Gaiellaceae bacterium]
MAGDVIAGRYRLLEPLGRGAMSAVWLARDEELGRHVALKTLAPNADRARFEREARAAAALAHPNICALFDYGEADGRPYMVLEYLSNGSLEERLAGGRPLADSDTYRIATEIASGLAHAHERGLVHRDLKPANVLFDAEGRAKIVDFGIARMTGTGTLTEAGTVLGAASYISPEQASGQPAGPASDVYSFGAILFRMLTGRLPFISSNAMELVRMHRDEQPPTVGAVRPDAPPRLAAIAESALAKDPALRPGDGAALLGALRADETRAVVPAATGAEATQVLRPARRRSRTPATLAALAALLLVAGGVAAALVASRGGGSTAPPPTLPPLSLRSVAALTTAGAATTAQSTAAAASTTAATSTTRPTTTRAATTTRTAPATTHLVTTRPTTTLSAPPAAATTSVLLPTTSTAQTTATTNPTTTAQTTTSATTTGP